MAYQSKYTGLQIDDILDSVEWKQGKIEDLASIRAGAQKGATALQSYTEKYTGTVTGIKINGVVKSGSGVIDLGTISTDISGKQDKLVDGVNIATINGQSLTEGGDLTIESGAKIYEWFYDGESESVTLSQEEYDNIVEADLVIVKLGGVVSFTVNKTDKELSEAVGMYNLTGQFDFQGSKMYIQIVISIATKLATITIEEQAIPTKTSQLENDSNFITSEDVAAVALSGSYNDLHDAPTIPSAVTESTVSGWGFTKNTGTYSKPSGGIPKSDLASAVQTSLGKADTAIQSTSFGELTDLAVVKGFESAQNGTVYALPDCDTGDEDDILLSRSSVKTINGQSIVGRGDITISSGNAAANVSAVDTGDVIDDVTVNYATKTYVDGLVGDINSILENIING